MHATATVLNGLPVYRVGDSIFVPLPKAFWAESGFPGQCTCGNCDGSGMWDTLAIATKADPKDHNDYARVVHWPELQGVNASRAVKQAQEYFAARRKAGQS